MHLWVSPVVFSHCISNSHLVIQVYEALRRVSLYVLDCQWKIWSNPDWIMEQHACVIYPPFKKKNTWGGGHNILNAAINACSICYRFVWIFTLQSLKHRILLPSEYILNRAYSQRCFEDDLNTVKHPRGEPKWRHPPKRDDGSKVRKFAALSAGHLQGV